MDNYNNQSYDFVAIDVEYTNATEQHICQVGIAVVQDLRVTERHSWLIQPPGNAYGSSPGTVHHITPEMTADAKPFHEVWPEIYACLKGKVLWAHNAASTELPVINKNIAYSNRCQGTQFEYIVHINDSRDLYRRPGRNGGNKLWQCCMSVGIAFDHGRYHDACFDAEKCAELVVAHVKGERPVWECVPDSEDGIRKAAQQKVVLQIGEFQDYADRIEAAKKKLKKEPTTAPDVQLSLFAEFDPDNGFSAPAEPLLTPEEESILHHTDVFATLSSTCDGAGSVTVDVFDMGDSRPAEGHDRVDYARLDTTDDNPIRGKKVAITGHFHIRRSDIKAALEEMGAKETSSVVKTTSALLVGRCNVGLPKLAAWEKLKHNGFVIPMVVGDDDLDRFLYGEAAAFGVGGAGEVRKDLNFTVKHFRDNHLSLRYPTNTIAGREMYFPPSGFMGRMDLLCQMCGNLGAFGNWEYCGDVNLVVLPNSSVEALQHGEKDDVVRAFEQYYNSQRSVTFNAEFITERDILKFVRDRIVRCGDDVTAVLYTKYLESAGIDPETDFKYGLGVARKEYEKEQAAAQ